jgi:hypothetical protein
MSYEKNIEKEVKIAEKGFGSSWKKFWKKIRNFFTGNSSNNGGSTTVEPAPIPTDKDQVPYADLEWKYGGFKGEGAKSIVNLAEIGSLTVQRNTMYYKWVKGGCENFGANNAHDAGYTICAIFFKNAEGKYVGGKFDWISTDRLSRGLGHINGSTPYGGWTSDWILNPSDVAFVIVGTNGNRTNVIKGSWAR